MGPLLSEYFPEPSQWTRVYRALVEVLSKDDVLAAVVKTWRAWEGNPDDAAPPESEQMPWIRLTPQTSVLGLKEVDARESGMVIKYEIAVKGTCYDDLGNLLEAFVNALKYQKPFGAADVLTYMRDAGAYSYDFVSAACSPYASKGPDNTTVTDMVAAGTIVLDMMISTAV